MKSEKKQVKGKGMPYPKLVVGNRETIEGLVILAKKRSEGSFEGIVVHQGESDYPIGRMRNNWSVDAFDDFLGKIILEN